MNQTYVNVCEAERTLIYFFESFPSLLNFLGTHARLGTHNHHGSHYHLGTG